MCFRRWCLVKKGKQGTSSVPEVIENSRPYVLAFMATEGVGGGEIIKSAKFTDLCFIIEPLEGFYFFFFKHAFNV